MNAGLLISAGYWPMWIWVFVGILFPVGDAMSQSATSSQKGQLESVKLNINQGRLFPLAKAPIDIFVTNPDIADVQIAAFDKLFVFGKKTGRTHVLAIDAKGNVIFDRFITVSQDLVEISGSLEREFPGLALKVSATPGRIVLSGTAQSALQAEHIISVVSGFLGKDEKIVNRMEMASQSQVNIRVRIVEMNRQASRNLGINWDILLNPGSLAIGLITGRFPAAIGNWIIPDFGNQQSVNSGMFRYDGNQGSASAVIDALAEEDLLTILAEPNLTSRSGETASFFAGGEFPIPISTSDDQVTFEFKKFGVILDITPTVLTGGKISIHIRPEVSEISDAGAIVVNNFSIPGISVRRTEATIELASGQSFAVAGMLQNQTRNYINEVPWLSELAVLGPLFRSSKYKNFETELVIIATAQIVEPTRGHNYATPIDGYRPADTNEKMLTGQLTKPSRSPELWQKLGVDGITLKGPAGYIY
ncbi:type II and III secretion system protein family protein [Sneathiella marina]|uniref:Type II and III secretion system protein family protein n=1 Tax=Sneathiella marina TaxID=2950108 RepID=A0ABY4W774_9PROT|nr:type II and III secretion system protein family protein [Sneathiella marina]USG63036.1 type II and III secretion system protein family protein [Sneathiella marina]